MKKHVVPLLSHRSFLPLGGKDGVLSALEVFLVVLLLGISAPTLPAQDFQPQPVSEYAEKSGPNTITFLSYPKYYTDSEGKLTPVVTDLVPSKSPDWDFEVTTGIWTLRVRADGTFQAEHAGNAFTYRLSQIGVGRGETFQPFEWGEPNWKNYQVVGDKIRWYDVFRDVDLVVRYIHDILKVDVIVKSSLMSQIRAEVKKGSLNADDYLTARFDIPNVWITTEAQLGGEKVDIYAERLDLQQLLEFVKDGKIVQRLRPVETHVLDAKGEPIVTFDEENSIRSAQTWRLKKDSPGIAEMSANLGDLALAPEGDVAIDPSFEFSNQSGDVGSAYDSYLDQSNPSTAYGSNDYLNLGGTTNAEKRIAIGFSTSGYLTGKIIKSATLHLNLYSISGSPNSHKSQIFKVTRDWAETSVTWNNPASAEPAWYGGYFDLLKYSGNIVTLPNYIPYYYQDRWVEFNVSYAFKSHFLASENDTYNKGFMVKMSNLPSSNTIWSFISKNNSTSYYVPYRPELTVQFGATDYGVWVVHDEDRPGSELERYLNQASYDTFKIVRYLDQDKFTPTRLLPEFAQHAQSNGMKVLIHCPISAITYGANNQIVSISSAIQFADHVEELLDGDAYPYIQNGTIFAIEIGGEEAGKKLWWNPADPIPTVPADYWYGNYVQGASFANYYLKVRERIKNNSTYPDWKKLQIWSGGAVEKHESLAFLDYKPNTNPPELNPYGSCRHFINGFIDQVTSVAIANNLGRFDFLPEVMTIHSYAGQLGPEGQIYGPDGNGANYTEWFDRLKEMFDICNNRGFIPNFATTEYGFSPYQTANNENGYAPINASETSHALYYLRSCLLNSTIKHLSGIGWLESNYFSHHGGRSGVDDFGFHNPPAQPGEIGTHRAIKQIARVLFAGNPASPTPTIQLNDPNTVIWVTAKSESIGSANRIAWCGWQTPGGQKWGAIWRYKHSRDFTEMVFSDSSQSFKIPGDWRSLDIVGYYKFTIGQGNAPLLTVSNGSSGDPTYSSGTTEFPNVFPVDENPLFLKFQ